MTSATIKVLHISFDTDTSRYRVTISNPPYGVWLLPLILIMILIRFPALVNLFFLFTNHFTNLITK